MQSIGIEQFHKKKYKFLGFDGQWLKHIGNLGPNFVGVIYGNTGSGKTEYCMRFAKYLCGFGTVGWLSYEQGDDYDLQIATKRNKMEEQKGIFFPVNPWKKRNREKTLFQELDAYLGKRNCPNFIFIDSIDYVKMTLDEYFYIKEMYGHKKGIIFISHEKNGMPETKVAQKILYDGKFGVFCNKMIALRKKNRIGGLEDYIIWDEEARRLNKLYFKKLENGD